MLSLDRNNILNTGEVPGLFASDERAECIECMRPLAKQAFGKKAGDMNGADMYAYFVRRCRANLHLVLAFSPIGSAFRNRLRKFPSLINCCTIDWFTAWPSDALIAVAETFLEEVNISGTGVEDKYGGEEDEET